MRYRVSKSVLRASLQGEEVLLSTETDQYHVVNATGRAVIAEFEASRPSFKPVVAQISA